MSMMQMLLGTSAGGAVTIADAFSTHLYTGNGSTQTITNGINLSGKGGLVWIKNRSSTANNILVDTERGADEYLKSNTTDSQGGAGSRFDAFNSNGFDVGASSETNGSGNNIVSWSFRKAPGFFDVVTWTGNGATSRQIAHNLGSVPGMYIVKKVNNSENWNVYHTSVGATKACVLNGTNGFYTQSNIFNDTEPTDSVFSVGGNSQVNENGDTYVAYVFAKDTPDMIKCGSYTGNGGLNNGPTVTLGFEPQWVLIKSVEVDGQNWNVADSARGFTTSVGATNGKELRWNSTETEVTRRTLVTSSTGFQIMDSSNEMSGTPSKKYIYMAIAAP